MSDISEIKQKIANQNMEFLQKNFVDLSGKKILDIGFGLGYNSKAMSDLGATVYGVEPDATAFKYAISNGLIEQANAFNCSLQNIPDNLLGTFDIVTVFLYCIDLAERDEFASTLARAIKPDGTVVIGITDEAFLKPYKYIKPAYFIMYSYFASVRLIENGFNVNKLFVLAKEPLILKKNEPHI